MKNKTVTAPTHNLDENWLMLAQAICVQAARDYEYILSDMPEPKAKMPATCNATEIEMFARDQRYTEVKMDAVMERINRVYFKQFRPYVEEHMGEIMKSWANVKKNRKPGEYNKDSTKKLHPYCCPNCGGSLHPGYKNKYIVCDGCNLNMRIPDKYRPKEGGKKCTT